MQSAVMTNLLRAPHPACGVLRRSRIRQGGLTTRIPAPPTPLSRTSKFAPQAFSDTITKVGDDAGRQPQRDRLQRTCTAAWQGISSAVASSVLRFTTAASWLLRKNAESENLIPQLAVLAFLLWATYKCIVSLLSHAVHF